MKAIAKNSNNTNNVENPTYEEYWPDIEGLAQRGVVTDESNQFYKDGCEDNVSTLSAPMREYAAPACQDTKSQQLINECFEIRHHRTHSKSSKIQCLEFHFRWPCKRNVEWSKRHGY